MMMTTTTARKRIMVIDDEPNVVSVLKIGLESKGFDVEVAYSGEEALKMIDEEGVPDLIILDLLLPKLSGYEVCAKIKIDFSREVPIVIHTARDRIIDEKLSNLCRADAFITKPYSSQQLVSTIKDLLHLP